MFFLQPKYPNIKNLLFENFLVVIYVVVIDHISVIFIIIDIPKLTLCLLLYELEEIDLQ